jgi:phosphoserine phosphatase
MSNNAIVASDLNGTLTTGSPVLAVYRWLTENQPESCPPLFEYRLLLSYLLVKVRLKMIDIWAEEAMCRVLGLIKDPDQRTLDAVMDYVVDHELWLKRRKVPIELLREFYQQGYDIYILSAAYHPAVEKFAWKISPARTFGIGTPVGMTPNGLTLDGPLNSRTRKIDSLMEAIGTQKLAIALGDTFADIPLLDRAERAIAVHPDPILKKKAEEEGWQIIS